MLIQSIEIPSKNDHPKHQNFSSNSTNNFLHSVIQIKKFLLLPEKSFLKPFYFSKLTIAFVNDCIKMAANVILTFFINSNRSVGLLKRPRLTIPDLVGVTAGSEQRLAAGRHRARQVFLFSSKIFFRKVFLKQLGRIFSHPVGPSE